MKKLMLTSALAGLALTASAIAQTSITGEIRVSHKAVGSEVGTGSTTTSNRGFGTEQQINFATKGKLNVGGLDYAAGFSIENDGLQTTSLPASIHSIGPSPRPGSSFRAARALR